MLAALALAILASPTKLPQKDWVDVYTTGYRFLAKKAGSNPKGYYFFGMPSDQPELQAKVRAVSELLNVPDGKYVVGRHTMLYLYIADVFDRDHVRFVAGNAPRYYGGLIVRHGKAWKVEQPPVPAKDRKEILQVGMLYLLRKGDPPYSGKETSYVGLVQPGGRATIGYNEAVDPSREMLKSLWRLGYHLKPVSEHPYSRDSHSPPRAEFGVGNIQLIDSRRAVVFIVRNDWYKEPGYNTEYGPNSARSNFLLVTKQGGKWLPKELRYSWQPEPAE